MHDELWVASYNLEDLTCDLRTRWRPTATWWLLVETARRFNLDMLAHDC